MANNAIKQADWLVLLYVAADDLEPGKSREGTISDECNAMMEGLKKANIAQNVTVVTLTDDSIRDQEQGTHKYPNITPAFRILENEETAERENQNKWITAQLDEETQLLFDTVNEVTELDTGTPRTLAYFIRWALREFPAKKVMLSIIGHGGGWSVPLPPGIAIPILSDAGLGSVPASHAANFLTKGKGGGISPSHRGLCLDETSKTAMSTPDLRRALSVGLGKRKLDVLFLDSCLMATIEVAYELRDHVDYLVAGQSLLWAQLPYEIYLDQSILSSATQPFELARNIVQAYNSKEDRVQKSWAVAAIDLNKINALGKQVETLAKELIGQIDKGVQEVIPSIVTAYYDSQQFDDNADLKVDRREGYVDLYDFFEKLAPIFANIRQTVVAADTNELSAAVAAINDIVDRNGRTVRQTDHKKKISETTANVAANLKPQKVVFSSLAQTDKLPPHQSVELPINLDNAFGLSIYCPLGDIIDAADDVDTNEKVQSVDSNDEIPLKARDILRIFLELYASQLRFSEAVPSWVKLLEKMRDQLGGTDDTQRDELLGRKAAPSDRSVSRDVTQRSKITREFNFPRQRTA